MDEHIHEAPKAHDIAEQQADAPLMHHLPVAEETKKNNSWAIPAAIVLGFALIAAAIYFSGSRQAATVSVGKNATSTLAAQAGAPKPIRPVDDKDHIRGNPNAPIVIVEYSDDDCPFCKEFHETMKKIMDTYGTSGKVAWVYRNFPIPQLHPDAPQLAYAGECVASLGGNDAFWKFTDQVFEGRDTNAQTDMSKLDTFAQNAGVNTKAFESCLQDGRTKADVQQDFNDGVNAGARGTPYSVVVVGNQQGVINGAQPYEYVKSVIDTLLKQMDEGTSSAKTGA